MPPILPGMTSEPRKLGSDVIKHLHRILRRSLRNVIQNVLKVFDCLG
jgi:hypothetical protein